MVPKIGDFGISKCFDEKQSRHLTPNQCGSWGYIAPESFGGVITLKSDIYSLGIVILEILTGHRGGARTAKKHAEQEEAKPGSGAEAESGGGDVGGNLVSTADDPLGASAELEARLEDSSLVADTGFNTFMPIAEKFSNNKIDIDMMARKIHRYPARIRALCLDERYSTPMVVSIGPYHHGREHLQKAEKVKYVAATNCSRNSGHSVQEMYTEVVQLARRARGLYENDLVAGISDDDFLPMMFFDACFLVQYMLIMSDTDDSVEIDDASLCSFFDSNDQEICHDIMLLENQLPWPVVQAVMKFVKVPLDRFINSFKGYLQDHKDKLVGKTSSVGNYDPPHLLGLLRFYIVGENRTQPDTKFEISSVSFSISAVELAEIGVTLKPSETTEISHMGFKTTGALFAELSLAPLSLDSERASWLINMAAHELCTTSNFRAAEDEESAVCSYLLLLAMLVDREEDVQELRTKRLLQGGGGLNDREALAFFRSVQSLRLGSCYVRIMNDIETYRYKRQTRTIVHFFTGT
ncbi:hypothetical protein PR202_gb16366 [Eleusine coracana subsp. coracana]|uniref:Protein kinase domain-containing protein n=1 Tax=Eleusine coracana subsp. coracana TaxID=191504 RepID=A0AAV5F1X9_ELECO|nr:hypothetical protein PR202_gb16366 [Eleusine coracana subsp. coracana]